MQTLLLVSIHTLPSRIPMDHEYLMGAAVIDQRDKIFSDGGTVQDELCKTLGGGSRLLG